MGRQRFAGRGSGAEQAARDAQIIAALHAGATVRAVAERFGLSPARISQIAIAAGLDLRARLRGRTHGVSGYVGGCRCETCRIAHRERMRAAMAKAGPPRAHNASGYTYHGCRCPICKRARAEQVRARKARIAAGAPVKRRGPPSPPR